MKLVNGNQFDGLDPHKDFETVRMAVNLYNLLTSTSCVPFVLLQIWSNIDHQDLYLIPDITMLYNFRYNYRIWTSQLNYLVAVAHILCHVRHPTT